jgi:peptidoglycan/xylan/chitin deacetylase (PgdA/CDA1 family)
VTSAKRIALRFLSSSGLMAGFRQLLHGRATIFMLHRFRDDAGGVHGHPPERLREALAYLRRARYGIVSLTEVFDRLAGNGEPLQGEVAFTIDDGFYDQATIAAPIFAEFDCPVTTFVTSGFLDRKLWFWWDRIEYGFEHARQRDVHIELAGQKVHYRWDDHAGRLAAQADFTDRCKVVSDEAKNMAIALLPEALQVDIPADVPPRYAPMTWDQLRRCEASGMTFGPHTVTHPVLSRASDEQVRFELSESWRRLRAEASTPVPIFCYPNGQFSDFGDREIQILRELKISGAVVGAGGYADTSDARHTPRGMFEVRRFSLPGDLPDVMQYTSGMERFKQLLRRKAA